MQDFVSIKSFEKKIRTPATAGVRRFLVGFRRLPEGFRRFPEVSGGFPDNPLLADHTWDYYSHFFFIISGIYKEFQDSRKNQALKNCRKFCSHLLFPLIMSEEFWQHLVCWQNQTFNFLQIKAALAYFLALKKLIKNMGFYFTWLALSNMDFRSFSGIKGYSLPFSTT